VAGAFERCEIEPAKDIVEHAIHLAVKRKERIRIGTPMNADLPPAAVPGDEILDTHGVFLLNSSGFRCGQTAAEASR
jgi:hypothetical protein